MSLYYHHTKLLTAKALRSNALANELGFWKIKTEFPDKTIEIILVRSSESQTYMLVLPNPFELIGSADTLKEITEIYNNYIGRKYVPNGVLQRADVYLLTN